MPFKDIEIWQKFLQCKCKQNVQRFLKSISRPLLLLLQLKEEKKSLFSLLFLIMRSSMQIRVHQRSPAPASGDSHFNQRKLETHSYFKMFLIFQFKIMLTVYRKWLMPKPSFLPDNFKCYILLSRIRIKLSLLGSLFLRYHV